MSRTSTSFKLILALMLGLLAITLLMATASGSAHIPFTQVVQNLLICPPVFNTNESLCQITSIEHQIIWDIRLPRVIMAMIAGAGLSICGVILQSVTRNPLADPYLFGISSGASLGAVIMMALISTSTMSVTFGALAGGAFSVILMLTLAGQSAVDVEKLLLSGVAVSFMLSAFTSLVLFYSEPELAATLLFWMMGSFANSQWNELILPAVTLSIGLTLFIIYRRWLDAIAAGDDLALTLGVPVNTLRLSMLMICAGITAVLVAHVGGIGFVGLMIPHIARFIVGAQIHRVLWVSLLIGAIFMVWVDVLAHTLLNDKVLPIGIVTSAIGSLFFFIILKYRRQ